MAEPRRGDNNQEHVFPRELLSARYNAIPTRAPESARWLALDQGHTARELLDHGRRRTQPRYSVARIPRSRGRPGGADAVRRNEPCHQQGTVVMAKPCDCQMSSPWAPAVVAGASTCAARRAPVQADIEALSAPGNLLRFDENPTKARLVPAARVHAFHPYALLLAVLLPNEPARTVTTTPTGGTACGRSCGGSNRRCGGACTTRFPNRGNGRNA